MLLWLLWWIWGLSSCGWLSWDIIESLVFREFWHFSHLICLIPSCSPEWLYYFTASPAMSSCAYPLIVFPTWTIAILCHFCQFAGSGSGTYGLLCSSLISDLEYFFIWLFILYNSSENCLLVVCFKHLFFGEWLLVIYMCTYVCVCIYMYVHVCKYRVNISWITNPY